MSEESRPTVDVICDLRGLDESSADAARLRELWKQFGGLLVGQPLVPGSFIHVPLPRGQLSLWVIGGGAGDVVRIETSFNVIDVMRSPKLLYRCRECGRYGPLRCYTCEQEKRPDPDVRLCGDCSHRIEDELTSYCREHAPPCSCRPDCPHRATHRCQRKSCRRLFGAHYMRERENDPDVKYCRRCFAFLFEKCVECLRGERKRPGLGKVKCAYRRCADQVACSKPLCYDHSYQWQIWGRTYRGVNLCGEHQRALTRTDPADLLYMIFSARPPLERRGRRRPPPTPFQLRRILSRDRAGHLSLEQLALALRSLPERVADWEDDSRAAQNRRRVRDEVARRADEAVRLQNELLPRVRSFYEAELGREAASRVTGLTVVDYIFKTRCYRVALHLDTANKGAFVGRGGDTVKRLRSLLNVEIDL